MSDQASRSEAEPLCFGGVIRKARTDANLTQEAVADAIGVTQSTVSAWESGGYPEPPNLAKLAALLKLDPVELVRLRFDAFVVAVDEESVPA